MHPMIELLMAALKLEGSINVSDICNSLPTRPSESLRNEYSLLDVGDQGPPRSYPWKMISI